MPYEKSPGRFELAGKSSHTDIVKNPDIRHFLEQAEFLRPPNDEEAENMCGKFLAAADSEGQHEPDHIFAMDGSYYESTVDERLPSTKVGYVKISTVHISRSEFGALRVEEGRFVDPFRVASLQRNKDSLTFVLPGTNMKWSGHSSVRDSFRARLDRELLKPETRFDHHDYKTSLRSTLFLLASMRPDHRGTGDPDRMILPKCPSCGEKELTLVDTEDEQFCTACNQPVYPSDALRLWEEVTDYQSNASALGRFMLAVEHMLPIHYLRNLVQANLGLDKIAKIAFFVDGPLAMFGNPAWISRPIMRYYAELNSKLKEADLPAVTIIGLQKSGQLVDHFSLIAKYVPSEAVYPVEDDYRYRYVVASRDPSATGFGDETYYGQDFLYKTASGRQFVLAIPYPFAAKEPKAEFHKKKTDMSRYSELAAVLKLVRDFETDLYENAVIPIALAHRYTAISTVPGGKVLDLLSKSAFNTG